jgi:DNA (cytosine-5)-methyltransferase 1
MAGIRPVWALDYNEAAVETARYNHRDVNMFRTDIRKLNTAGLDKVDLVFCGIPCQPFTRIGKRLLENDERDISESVADVLMQLLPETIIFENVREYKSSNGFDYLNYKLQECGYSTEWQVLNVADYGIPQRRLRLWGIASLRDNIVFPEPTHTKKRSLFDMKEEYVRFGKIRDGLGMKPLTAKALKGVLRRYGRHSARGNGFSVQIIDDEDMMMTVLGVMYRGSGASSHSTLVWDNGVLRNVSFLEACRAQSFPEDYVFLGLHEERWQQVANAIPPMMASVLARTVLASIHNN